MEDLKGSNSTSIGHWNVRKVLVSYMMGGKLSTKTASALMLSQISAPHASMVGPMATKGFFLTQV